MSISIEISPGELLDRISILSIKAKRLTDPQKRAYMAAELRRLEALRSDALVIDDHLRQLCQELESVNDEIWRLTDDVYRRRARGAIDVALAKICLRAFELNGDRSEIKRKIDAHLGAAIREVKNYGDAVEA
ncbi:MAG: hypothetical protein HYR63_24650 [Proteobacteria bacterium]|nr:hypothetical protein [Pseudomonadota bacterium]